MQWGDSSRNRRSHLRSIELHSRSTATLLALGLLASTGYGDVLILEAPGLGAQRDAQTAIDLAPEGATLVFGPEAIGGKFLTLVGNDHPDFSMEGRVLILNLAEGQTVRAQGLEIQPDPIEFDPFSSRVLIQDCEGAVRFSGCSMEGRTGVAGPRPTVRFGMQSSERRGIGRWARIHVARLRLEARASAPRTPASLSSWSSR